MGDSLSHLDDLLHTAHSLEDSLVRDMVLKTRE